MASDWSRRALLASIGSTLIAGCTGGHPAETDGSCPDSGGISITAETNDFTVITDNNTVESLTFMLTNQTTCAVEVDPTAWKLKRKIGNKWSQVTDGGGGVSGDETRTLDGGDTHKWNLSLTQHPTPHGRTTTYIFTKLKEGNYRFTIPVTLTTGEQITRRAQFEIRKRTTSENTTEE